MINSIFKKIFGTVNQRYLKSLQIEVGKISALEEKYSPLSDNEVCGITDSLKKKLSAGESLDDILPEAFALVREAAKRVLGQRHYDVQMMGGIALHKGMIAEMKTGEGKTLAATLPAYLNALEGKGVHIVTTNDYLAKRDALWMGSVYKFLGLSVGCITNDLAEEDRKDAYNRDVIFVTNNELGFDYLRDNMRHQADHFVQRKLNYAIVDEVDSILIDEARTPLIISGPSENRSELYCKMHKLIFEISESDYELDEKSRSVSFNEEGTNKIEKILYKAKLIEEGTSLFDIENITILHHANQALKAKVVFKSDVDYIVKNGQVMIIDEFTGRIMEGRRFSEGLHQALEAKEGVNVQSENQTLASITFQNYFRMYPKLSGMTGTARTEAAEFEDIYKLKVVSVPTKNNIKRKDEDDLIYRTTEEKNTAIVEEIEKCHANNQPILLGTTSIEKSEHLSRLLKKKKIKHQVLNAKHHEKEALIIAQAGKPGAVTIATNMAGRGTDIMLGGNAEMIAREKNIKNNEDTLKYQKELEKITKQVAIDKQISIDAGGLLVIGTERHDSRRIDNQLRGRSGRMGDPGRSIFYLSLEDDLMRIFASKKISTILKTLGLKDGEAIFHPMISRTIEKAQSKVEERNYEIRKNLLKFDDVMNDQRKVIYEQRHEIIEETLDQEKIGKSATDIYTDLNQSIVSEYSSNGKFKEDWDIEGLSKRLEIIYGNDFGVEKYLQKDGLDLSHIEKYISDNAEKLLSEKRKKFGDELFCAAEKRILLITIDQLWKDHLLSLDHLRHGIYLRAFAQKDPLNEYKKEAFEYFSTMLDKVRETYITRIMKMEIDVDHQERSDILKEDNYSQDQRFSESRMDPALSGANNSDKSPQGEDVFFGASRKVKPEDRNPSDHSTWGRISRNELCPCGSQKKYKQCHGEL